METRKLAIIIGHKFAHPGAKAIEPINEYEFSYNSKVARRLAERLQTRQIEARIFDRNLGNLLCYLEVNEWVGEVKGAAIELHFNSFNDASARGTETLYQSGQADNLKFAKHVHDSVSLAFGRQGKLDRGIRLLKKGDRGYENLSLLNCPAVIVEPFFGSNAEDCILAKKVGHLYPESLANGVASYLWS